MSGLSFGCAAVDLGGSTLAQVHAAIMLHYSLTHGLRASAVAEEELDTHRLR